jgi:FtsH-binding integral membrane protein
MERDSRHSENTMQSLKKMAFTVGLALLFALLVIWWYEFLKIN